MKKSFFDRIKGIITGPDAGAEGVTTLELRRRMLREIEERYSQHQTATPPSLVEVYLRAPETDRQQLLHAAIHEEEPPFEQAVLLQLRNANLRPAPGLRVATHLVEAWPEEFNFADADRRWIFVKIGAGPAPVVGREATIRVLEGRAEQAVYRLDFEEPVTIGRGQHHRLTTGRRRVNTIAFVDAADDLSAEEREINEKVSRVHATITYEQQRFRLHWDGNNPVVHIRRGARLPIESTSQYAYLQHGDRIELGGGALLEFLLEPDTEADESS